MGIAEAQAKIDRYREDPVLFVREQFKVAPDDWQIEALNFYAHGMKRTCMKACKGPGKTAALAWMAWHFLLCYPNCKVIATSISADNLSDGLWSEMSLWQKESPLLMAGFQWYKTSINARESPETWFMAARAWAKSADASQQADTMAGKHAKYMLFILDEAGGIPSGVMAAAEAALATGVVCRIAMAGNPTDLSGPLYEACTRDRETWNIIEINSDPDNPKRAKRVSIEWAREQIKKYGKENPWVQVNVFGRFPAVSSRSLLGPDDITAAVERIMTPNALIGHARALGVDCALYGDDRTCIFPRQGPRAFPPRSLRGLRGPDIAAHTVRAANLWNADGIMIDSTGGWADGAPHFIRQAGHDCFEINFSSAALDPRFFNKRSEMWFEMAAWVRTGMLPPDMPGLYKELCEPTYSLQNGKIRVEEKAQVKDRLGFSPDEADGLALTFAMPLKAKAADGKRTAFDEHFENQEFGADLSKQFRQQMRANMSDD